MRITITDVLTKVSAHALMRHRDMNVQFADDALLVFPSADVGIAVAAPQGLVVPVVRGAERLTIAQIAAVRADLVGRARDGKLRTEDLEGGTFTISNLGMYDIDQFIAVLNPPQASILAVGSTRDQVVPRDGDLVVLPLMTMTLTCDHRAVDGATGAEFLKTLKAFLEDPGLALVMAPTVWYHVRELDDARHFYRETLGFEETAVDFSERWSHLKHGEMELGLAEGEPQVDSAVAHVDVDDLKAEADRLRDAGVNVGIILELQGEMRLLDVYDPDGNRIQLAQELVTRASARRHPRRPVPARHAPPRVPLAARRGHRAPGVPLRAELGAPRRRRRARARGPARVRRGVVPALLARRAGLRLRRRGRRRS